MPGGSRLAVGSSRTRRCGRGARMSARARRCCSPPDRAPGGTRLEAGQADLREGGGDGRQHPVAAPATVLQPEGDLVGHVRHHELRLGILEDEADLLAQDARRRDSPRPDPRRAGRRTRCRAGRAARSRRGPGRACSCRTPTGPTTSSSSPGSSVKRRSWRAGRDRPAYRPAEPHGRDGRRPCRASRRGGAGVGHAPPGKVSRTPVRRSALRSHQPRSPASTMPEMTSTTAIVACTSSPNLSGG